MTSLALSFASIVACGAMIWAGHAWHANPGTYFREGKIGTYLSVAMLAAAGVVSILTSARVSSRAGQEEDDDGGHDDDDAPTPRRRRSSSSFWRTLGVVMIVLAVDDLYRLHESIDHAWHRMTGLDPKYSFTASLDNWIVASYGVVAALLFWRHRRYVATLGWFNRTMAAAFAGFAAMLYADAFVFRYEVEDSLKLVSGTLILCAFLAVYFSEKSGRTRATVEITGSLK
jgi:hypothetical protein